MLQVGGGERWKVYLWNRVRRQGDRLNFVVREVWDLRGDVRSFGRLIVQSFFFRGCRMRQRCFSGNLGRSSVSSFECSQPFKYLIDRREPTHFDQPDEA